MPVAPLVPALLLALGAAPAAAPAAATSEEETRPPRIDHLTFARGAFPLAVGGTGASLKAGLEHATAAIDGNSAGFTFVVKAGPDTDTEFLYELPAPTTFDRFAVPSVLETPSPSQTFARDVEVYGSSAGPGGPFTLLASARLSTHQKRGLFTEIPVTATLPVLWIKLRLVGGIEVLREAMFYEFSEIIGNGTQEPVPRADRFSGMWRGRGLRIELLQDGAAVRGCYDTSGELAGTVTGNILRATGVVPASGIPSLFILNVAPDGTLRAMRSTNGAPFRLYTGDPASGTGDPICPDLAEPSLGCGSVIHGITFDFDSSVIRPDSEPVLAGLFAGLNVEPGASVRIEGHTSNEGSDAYNLELSERRARAVVEDLVRRGLDPARIAGVGRGESVPIASNDDESGRALNRRVEVHCVD
jgi:hypothetical protein